MQGQHYIKINKIFLCLSATLYDLKTSCLFILEKKIKQTRLSSFLVCYDIMHKGLCHILATVKVDALFFSQTMI